MKLRVIASVVLSTLMAGAANATQGWHDERQWLPPGLEKAWHDHQGHKGWHKYQGKPSVQVGARPYWLVEDMDDGPLKERLKSCDVRNFQATDFSIGLGVARESEND